MVLKSIFLFIMMLSLLPYAMAEQCPKLDIFIGYSLVPTDLAGETLHGGSLAVACNINSVIGIVGDFGAYNNFHGGALISYMIGPRISFPETDKLEPYVQVLLGGTQIIGFVGHGDIETDGAFGMAAGGGIDMNMTKHISLRLMQVEYLYSPYREYMEAGFQYTGNFDQPIRQTHFRISSGINFRF